MAYPARSSESVRFRSGSVASDADPSGGLLDNSSPVEQDSESPYRGHGQDSDLPGRGEASLPLPRMDRLDNMDSRACTQDGTETTMPVPIGRGLQGETRKRWRPASPIISQIQPSLQDPMKSHADSVVASSTAVSSAAAWDCCS